MRLTRRLTRLTALAAAVFLLFVSSVFAADRCPQGETKDGYLAYKVCLWRDIGPAAKLVWGRNESRGEVRKELYRGGTLYTGCVPIEVGLERVNLSNGARILKSAGQGRVEEDMIPSSGGISAKISVNVCEGEGTVWVPNAILTSKHYVALRSIDPNIPLTYNHPDSGDSSNKSWFTEEGEDVTGAGESRYPATRLNTKAR
jgi:hypothetical protein